MDAWSHQWKEKDMVDQENKTTGRGYKKSQMQNLRDQDMLWKKH